MEGGRQRDKDRQTERERGMERERERPNKYIDRENHNTKVRVSQDVEPVRNVENMLKRPLN